MGESIPIRLFLSGYDLTPTMRDVNKKFSVRYYVNLVLVDEEERRYFKQQEIVLWRKADPKAARNSCQIELYFDRGNHHDFLSLVRQLSPPGELTQSAVFDFEFHHVEKPYESYTGTNVKLRYFLRVVVVRRLSDLTKELDLAVHALSSFPEMVNSLKMEVGIEDCLHIEFEYNKSK
ncbi:Vacuolar protein sorting-associated protein 26B [Geodia barretti]|uniref:Vacuolar protein sorting-associated protein 26B n=1 Tax=Geodia barretti TaxID=519541 RepID=A0AA35T5P3_GEOBA|nr:Vacuolar protein sorting-associated protein 26B [Geodia barretti]